MADIVGNAAGLDHRPTGSELPALMTPMSLRPLLEQDANAPMLVINGADDVHVPQHDTLVFQHRPNTEVQLVPDTGHCAVSKLGEVLPAIAAWISRQLDPSSTDGR
jgi:esterase FrsA